VKAVNRAESAVHESRRAICESVRRVRARSHNEAPRRAQGRSSLNVLRSGSSARRGMTRLAVRPRSPMSTGRTVPTAVTLRPRGHGEECDEQHDKCSAHSETYATDASVATMKRSSGAAVCTPTENDTTLAAEAAARRRDLNQQARGTPCGSAAPGRSPAEGPSRRNHK
jgi:hypothetical protein